MYSVCVYLYLLQLCRLFHLANLQLRSILLEHTGIVILRTDVSWKSCADRLFPTQLTFQNCFDASLPPTLVRIFDPPGCSLMKSFIPYTEPSMMMYKPVSGVLCSATSLVVNCFDILLDDVIVVMTTYRKWGRSRIAVRMMVLWRLYAWSGSVDECQW